jgi:Glycogen synthase kinase-3 binding
MPSKQTNNDVIAIEELVNEIKQNLRLKAAPPTSVGADQALHHPLLQPPSNELFLQQTKSLQHPPQQQLVIKKQRSRPSPYHIPCRSWSESSTTQKPRKTCKNDENNIEDPYELLQSLIKNNSLVKEAVRRLQLTNASAYSRKQNYFYDSDEDNRSPIVMMCQLES